MITDPDKKSTKRGWIRTILSPFMGANIRRARLQTRDLRTARAKLAAQRETSASIKDLRKRGILK